MNHLKSAVKDDGGTLQTLPDLLRPGLRLVFVGINPGLYSAARGHYFARRTNRFWPALSRSRLSGPIRAALGVTELLAEHDTVLPEFGIGFTDVVKRPTSNAGQLAPAEFVEGARQTLDLLTQAAPQAVCFLGLTGFRPFAQQALGLDPKSLALGAQPCTIAGAQVFVVPSPSPANAHFSLAAQVVWFDALADFLDTVSGAT